MSAIKYTPGPWRLTEDGHVVDSADCCIAIDGIAQPHGYVPPEDVSRANARLIAAAPELLAELKKAQCYCPGGCAWCERRVALLFKAECDA